jgi:hypothetical protein
MRNKELIPKFNEIIEIESIVIPKNSIVDLNTLLMARMRIKGFGQVQINEKNELVSGVEGLLLAIERGEKVIKILRTEPISLKPNRKYGTY